MVSARSVFIIAVIGSFAAGTFFASPELRAYASTIANDVICSGCVGTTDLAGNAVTAAKIKDGEVKTADIGGGAVTNAKLANGAVNSAKIADNSITAADIATDAVGAELQGVTKLLFGQCSVNSADGSVNVGAGSTLLLGCTISGTDGDDFALATLRTGNSCFEAARARPLDNGDVQVGLRNECPISASVGSGTIAVIVYDK